MPNQKGQKKVVDNSSIKTASKSKKGKPIDNTQNNLKAHSEPSRAEKSAIIPEEKVEVLIKEIIRINPRDFSAFKHALEDFVKSWES